jgi:hypothetical protein
MTEDAGPPGPPERFSSLPIREADATAAAGTGGSELIIRCDMSQAFGTGVGSAQAFEITGNRTAANGCAAAGAAMVFRNRGFPESRFPKAWFPRVLVSQGYGFPDKISRSLPSRPDPVRIVSLEYGSLFGLTQARQTSPEAPGDGPIPVPAILPRLSNSGGFDKTTPAPV